MHYDHYRILVASLMSFMAVGGALAETTALSVYEQRLREWAARRKGIVTGIHGSRHLLGIEFADIGQSREFVRKLKAHGLDISVQTYKTDCPPVALTKLPIIAGYEVVDWLMTLLDHSIRRT